MTRLTDDAVGGLIKELPRTEASPDFTEQVLRKLDDALARRARRRSLAAAGALVLLVASGSWLSARYERSRAAERVESLRTEYRELELELQKLRALASELEPVLELGGTEQVDIVFDLRELGNQDASPRAEPISHERARQP